MNGSFESFFTLAEQDRRDVFEAAANRLDTMPGYVDKDFQVCFVLDVLYNGLPDGHPKLCFREGHPCPRLSGSSSGFLDWRDWRVLGALKDRKGGEHGERILERDHYRKIWHTPESPGPKDIQELAKQKAELEELVAQRFRRKNLGMIPKAPTFLFSRKLMIASKNRFLLFRRLSAALSRFARPDCMSRNKIVMKPCKG